MQTGIELCRDSVCDKKTGPARTAECRLRSSVGKAAPGALPDRENLAGELSFHITAIAAPRHRFLLAAVAIRTVNPTLSAEICLRGKDGREPLHRLPSTIQAVLFDTARGVEVPGDRILLWLAVEPRASRSSRNTGF